VKPNREWNPQPSVVDFVGYDDEGAPQSETPPRFVGPGEDVADFANEMRRPNAPRWLLRLHLGALIVFVVVIESAIGISGVFPELRRLAVVDSWPTVLARVKHVGYGDASGVLTVDQITLAYEYSVDGRSFEGRSLLRESATIDEPTRRSLLKKLKAKNAKIEIRYDPDEPSLSIPTTRASMSFKFYLTAFVAFGCLSSAIVGACVAASRRSKRLLSGIEVP
jgi:hypothetical protein